MIGEIISKLISDTVLTVCYRHRILVPGKRRFIAHDSCR
jgi:hypothetical protein